MWIRTRDRLPTEGQRVLIWVPVTHLTFADGPAHVFAASFRRGQTAEEVERTGTLRFGDQHGNNRVPYQWSAENGGQWFGQDVTAWQPLPEPPKE